MSNRPTLKDDRRKPKIQKRTPFGRILKTETFCGRILHYHATKGWRSEAAARQ